MSLSRNIKRICHGSTCQKFATPATGTNVLGTFTKATLFPAGAEDSNDLPEGVAFGFTMDDADLALLQAAANGSTYGVQVEFRAYTNGDVATGTLVETKIESDIISILDDAGLAALQAGKAAADPDHTVNCPAARLSPQVRAPGFDWDEVVITSILPVAGIQELKFYAFSNNGPN